MQAQEIIDFWFSKRVKGLWWKKDPAFDEEIRRKFMQIYETARQKSLQSWQESSEGSLALVLVLDQFPRNMFRDQPQAFASDEQARHVSATALEQGFDDQMADEQKSFLYMPFMHSEDLQEQEKSVALYKNAGLDFNLDFAVAHRDIVACFGRFPHRNDILGRESTPEEIDFLKQPGSSF